MRALVDPGSPPAEVTLAGGAAMVAPCDPVYEAATVIGAVLRLRPAAGPGAPRSQPAGHRRGAPSLQSGKERFHCGVVVTIAGHPK